MKDYKIKGNFMITGTREDWRIRYADTGESVGYVTYRTIKSARLGHIAGTAAGAPGSTFYESAASLYAD